MNDWKQLRRRWQVSGRDRSVFFRCLATLFQSGVRLDLAFELLSRQSENPELASVSGQIARRLASGHSLTRCFDHFPWCFSTLHVRMVQVGERSGALGAAFSRLAEHEERRDRLTRQLSSSLILPLLITLGCLLLVGILLPILLGNLLELMAEQSSSLPWPTRLLLHLSQALRQPLFYASLLLGLPALAWALLRLHTEQQRLLVHRYLLQVPGLGRVLRLSALAQFSRSLGLMLEVGLPLLPSLELAGSVAANPLLARTVDEATRRVRDGEELAVALAGNERFFPAAWLSSLEAGTQAGTLGSMLAFLTQLTEVELESALDTVSRLLEPLVLCLVGAMVGFCVVATLLPMARLLDSL